MVTLLGKNILEKEKIFDKVVFLGDYFDSFSVSVEDQISNFKDILFFYHQHPKKITLLIGNHDLHYLPNISPCAGFKHEVKSKIGMMLWGLIQNDILKVCEIQDNIILSHAGISKEWCTSNYGFNFSMQDINCSLKNKPEIFDFKYKSGCSNYGDNTWQSPLWIRPKSLQISKIEYYIQVIGHTHSKTIQNYDNKLYVCDSLPNEYLVMNDNQFLIKTL